MREINSKEVVGDFWLYVCHFKYIFLLMALVTLLLAAGLYYSESSADSAARLSADVRTQELVPLGTTEVHSKPTSALTVPKAQAAAGRMRRDSEYARELQQVSGTLSELKEHITADSRQLKMVEERLQSIATALQAAEMSRHITPSSALYDVCIAMLGLGDFGARTGCGRIIVVVAGWWGVLASGLITALLVAAAMNQYRRVS